MIRSAYAIIFAITVSASIQSAFGQYAPDTLRYSVSEAEAIFLQKNLPLLAEKLNIDQADAKIVQARVWPNPTFTLDELQVYKNSTTDEIPPIIGEFWRDRNFAMQLEQLILTAGKRRKNINLEVRNKEMAENMFTDLLLALKAEFRQTSSELIYLQSVDKSWRIQLTEVSRLVNAQESQFKEGFISQADLFRLKGLQISLASEINTLSEELNEKQQRLKTLMNLAPGSFILFNDIPDASMVSALKKRSLAELLSLTNNNTKRRISQSVVKVSEAQLEIEKANRVPDITLITSYDRNGSTMRNFVGVGASIDLPLFNRNKGNIRAARIEVEKSKLLMKNVDSEVDHSVIKQWNDLSQAISLYESIEHDYIQKLDQMSVATGKNFADRNISLLQFLDYYESFRESKERYYNVIKNISLKKEELNYLLGEDL